VEPPILNDAAMIEAHGDKQETPAVTLTAAELYLDLLKRALTRTLFTQTQTSALLPAPVRALRWLLRQVMVPAYIRIVRRIPAAHNLAAPVEPMLRRWILVDPQERAEGRDWPADAETMIGLARLDNIQRCVETVLRDSVPGDLIEAGVWRGGATILMRATLAAYGDQNRDVWVADSFAGVPPPDERRAPLDKGDPTWAFSELAVPLETVKENFARYGLLDERVRFLAGWFKDTLPHAPIERLAVLRLDADLYESTMTALEALYPKLSPGGFVIVDDYNTLATCRAAVDDYRARLAIDDPILKVDWNGAYWRRS
jgi:O-methyltransferase